MTALLCHFFEHLTVRETLLFASALRVPHTVSLARRVSRVKELMLDMDLTAAQSNKVGGINLGQGICDMPTPELVREAAIDAIRSDKNIYSYAEGAIELREAIAEKVRRYNKIDVDPERELVVRNSGTGPRAPTCGQNCWKSKIVAGSGGGNL